MRAKLLLHGVSCVLESKDVNLSISVRNILNFERIDIIKFECKKFADWVLRDIGGIVIYVPGKEYYI